MLRFVLLLTGVLAAPPLPAAETILAVTSATSYEHTVTALRGAIEARALRVLREDARTDTAPRRHALYFCDFDLLPRAIAADPRSGDAMPCQITVVEDQTSVRLVAKPPGLGLENPDAPTRAVCAQARDLLVDILWEAAQ